MKDTIKKKYSKLNLSQNEKVRLNEILFSTREYGGQSNVSNYKNSINALFVNKYGYLLAFNSVTRIEELENENLYIDYIKEDSIYYNIAVDNFIKGEDLMFLNLRIKFIYDNIYVLDLENSKLYIYEY